MLSQNRSALITHAISKFSPEVFVHPVLVRFGKQDVSTSLKIAANLLSVAKNLQDDDPIGACQILLICTVYQNYSGHRQNAFKTIQNALALAKSSGLLEEVLWALWGACAIRFQQGNIKQAASILEELQTELNKRDEWVLADFVDVTKRSLLHPITKSNVDQSGKYGEQAVPDLLKITFDWLHQWGYFNQYSQVKNLATSENPVDYDTKKSIFDKLFFWIRSWRAHWHSFMRIFKGKKVQYSQDAPKNPMVSISPPADVSYSPKVSSPKLKPALRKKQSSEQAETTINMIVKMLGPFSITIQDTLIKLSASRGLSVLKYLLLHHKQSTPREVLMDTFWPDADPEAARNNLNVAIYSLRKELRSVTDVSVICHENGAYYLSSDLKFWLDVEEFEHCIKTGKQMETRNQTTTAVVEYETAISIYQGDFLEENPYEEWTILDRERLRVAYLDTIDRLSHFYFNQERYSACITLCQLILGYDLCREDAHYRLMQCYSRLGQAPLAIRQFQICTEALQDELEVDPAPETTQLYERIRNHEQI